MRGGLEVRQVDSLLDRDSDLPARLTAPPSGLFLERVFYEGDARELAPLCAPVPVAAASARSAGR